MRAALIAVGDELLDGRVVDTNSAMLAGKLLELGIDVSAALVTGDPLDDIVRAIHFSLEEADVVLLTGGLGPTADDRTRVAVARVAGVELEEDSAVWERIRRYIEARGFPVSLTNRQQAQFPRGSTVLPNRTGTAPGILLELTADPVAGKRIFALPGVPPEAERMFDEEVAPRLAGAAPLLQRTLCFGGVSESYLGQLLHPHLAEGGDVRVGITSSWGLLRVTVRAREPAPLEAALTEVRRIGAKWFVGEGYCTLEALLAEKLLATRTTLALAESLTAGLAASRLGRVPGISAVLLEGIVAYSNASKQGRLGVPSEVLASKGAVSEECATLMAEGLARTSGALLTGSATGIAGPGGGSPAKPVGLVWFATCFRGHTRTRERRYGDAGRNTIRQRAASDLLLLLLQTLAD